MPIAIRLIYRVWHSNPRCAAAVIVLRLVRSLAPVTLLWVAKLIMDEIVRASVGHPDWRRLWLFVCLELGLAVANDAVGRTSSFVEALLADLFTNRISVDLMEHASRLDLSSFEDPEFYDHLERARRATIGRMGILTQLVGFVQDGETAITLSAALTAHSLWLMVLVLVAVVPGFLAELKFGRVSYDLAFKLTAERRELEYFRLVAAGDNYAKEVQSLGLGSWLVNRYKASSERLFELGRSLAARRAVIGFALGLVSTLAYYAGYATVIRKAAIGLISLGMLTFLSASFARSRDLFQRLLFGAGDILDQLQYVRDLFVFLDRTPAIRSPARPVRIPQSFDSGLVFEGVGFKYPRSERWALRGLRFSIDPGESRGGLGD